MSYIKTEVPGYVKDTTTGTVLNTNFGEYMILKESRRRRKEHDELKEKLARLESLLEKK